MPTRIAIGSADSLVPGESRVLDTPSEPVAVFNIDGVYYACSNRCPHAGGPLSDGFLRGTAVVCPWHGWDFDLSLTTDAAMDGVIRYRVLQEAGELFLELP